VSARRDYLLDVADRLWAPPAEVGRRVAAGRTSYVLVPSGSAPRLVLPARARRAAGAAVTGFTGHRAGRERWRSRLLAWAMTLGAGERLLRDRLVVAAAGGIDAHLAQVLGRPVLVSMHVGPPRANRKPVLQLLDRRGTVLAFVKIGTDPLTARLLAAEAAALTRVGAAAPPGVRVAEVLHHGRWRDLDVLVQSPLPVAGTRPPSPRALAAAMVGVARIAAAPPRPVAGSPYPSALAADLDALGDDGTALAREVRRAVAADPQRPLVTGAWHGDWSPWNCSGTSDGGLLLWDWERFGDGVPQGYDALHHWLQSALRERGPAPADARGLVAEAPRLLAPFGTPAADAPFVALLYLADIGRRYLTDRQSHAGGRGGRVGAWIVPAVRAGVDELSTGRV
jgi:hypothetical protein